MDPVVARLSNFVFWVVSFYIALLITVVPALSQGVYLMAAVGFVLGLLIFVVVPTIVRVVMAIHEARRGLAQDSAKPKG